MTDFTGVTLQDQYNVIVAERERRIAGDAWRRRWMRLNTRDASSVCCAEGAEAARCAGPVSRPSSVALP